MDYRQELHPDLVKTAFLYVLAKENNNEKAKVANLKALKSGIQALKQVGKKTVKDVKNVAGKATDVVKKEKDIFTGKTLNKVKSDVGKNPQITELGKKRIQGAKTRRLQSQLGVGLVGSGLAYNALG